MSFILEGLKKLEEKRHKDSVPDLLTVHAPKPHESKKKNLWPSLLITALIINALLFTLWLRPWQNNTDVSYETPVLKNSADKIENKSAGEAPALIGYPIDPIESPAPAKAEATAQIPHADPADTESQDVMKETPIEEASFKLPEKKEYETSAEYNLVPEESDSVFSLSELPLSVRQELPEIDISAHIYSNNPSSRIVNINGNIIREGGKIMPGLNVDEITMTDVILKYREYRFRMRGL
jgi:hypothetical protein